MIRPVVFARLALISGLVLVLGCATEYSRSVSSSAQNHWKAGGSPPAPVLENPPELPQPDPRLLVDLSLEQAISLGLQNNRDLAIEELNPVIAGAYERIERGVFQPELFAQVQQDEERTSEISRSTEEQFSVKGKDERFTAGIRNELATGTDVEASVGHGRSISDRTPEQQEARLGLSVTQALLRGFGPGVNLASVQQAELGTRASLYELRGFVEALIAECETAYWNFILAREEIAIFERSLEVAIRQRDDIEEQIEVGALAENDAAAARAEVARRKQALIEARSQLEDRRLRLLGLIYPQGLARDEFEVNAGSLPRTEPEPIEDVADRLLLADRLRPELNEARLRHEQNRLETVKTRNGLLPRLDLFVDLGKTGYADALSDAFQNLDEDTYEVSGGIRFSQYLGNQSARGRHDLAMATYDQSRIAIANLEDIVRLDVRLAVTEVERIRQQISASAETRAFQEESLRAEQERFDVGAGTALLVAQAQRDLLASQIVEVEAIVQYRVALVDLYLAEGSLLERRGITLGGTGPQEELPLN
jgi:outer membrane protein TolC